MGRRRRWASAAGLTVALVAALPPRVARADWPAPRHDGKRTGVAAGTSNLTAPVPYWRRSLGGSIGLNGALGSGGASGAAGAGGAGRTPIEDRGCSCSAAGAGSPVGAPWATSTGLGVSLAAVARRRRGRRRRRR